MAGTKTFTRGQNCFVSEARFQRFLKKALASFPPYVLFMLCPFSFCQAQSTSRAIQKEDSLSTFSDY